jgi:hypothetical protein
MNPFTKKLYANHNVAIGMTINGAIAAPTLSPEIRKINLVRFLKQEPTRDDTATIWKAPASQFQKENEQ